MHFKILFFTLIFLCAVTSNARCQQVRDRVELISETLRESHSATLINAQISTHPYRFGTLTLPIEGAVIAPGGSVEVTFSRSSGELCVTLATAPQNYGKIQSWHLLVNGQERYYSSEADPGGGPTRSVFLSLPASRRAKHIKILADKRSTAPITLVSLKLIEPQPAKFLPQMGLALLSRQSFGYGIDAAEIRALRAMIPTSPELIPSVAVLYNFCVRDSAGQSKEISRLTALAKEQNIPLRIAFQVHWAGIPGGVPDGAGGKYTDIPYQQVCYDPAANSFNPDLAALMEDRYDPRFGLSIPNVWSDTPWLTFNHPRLNRFRELRLKDALRCWQNERNRLIGFGLGNLLPGELSTGEETIYWAKGVEDSRYNTVNENRPRSDLMADFNAFTVSDAIKDGVFLDPRDGLNSRERWWLHQNLGRQQQRIIDWMQTALAPDPLLAGIDVDDNPLDITRRNLYTEPYAMPCFPMKDISSYHPGLEAGYVREGRSGGEYWSGATMTPWLLKEREMGRIALPNLECSGADDAQLNACMQAAYACGARFATLYNHASHKNIAGTLKSFAMTLQTGSVQQEFLPDILVNGSSSLTVRANSPLIRQYTAPAAAFGINSIGLWLSNALSSPADVRVTLRDPANGQLLRESITMPGNTPAGPVSLFISTLFPQSPGKVYVISIDSPDNSAAQFASAPDGEIAVRLGADLKRERTRSISLQIERDARDILDSLSSRVKIAYPRTPSASMLLRAQKALKSGRPAQAYMAAVRAEQLMLPSAFVVKTPGGKLSPYAVSVYCSGGAVQAVLRQWSDQSVTISLRSDKTQQIILKSGSRRTKVQLAPGVAQEVTF